MECRDGAGGDKFIGTSSSHCANVDLLGPILSGRVLSIMVQKLCYGKDMN
jgi:hypothetical protein